MKHGMDKEILKLSKLCQHWAKHNETHKDNFIKWRDIAETKGLDKVVDNLNKAIEMMDECNKFLILAQEEL